MHLLNSDGGSLQLLHMSDAIDRIMVLASEALARLDYLTCERRCLEALSVARSKGDWRYYARILMPLQESRRQRRMIAADGVIRLGTGDLDRDWCSWPDDEKAGCLVVTHPHTADTVREIESHARQQCQFVEVLFADSELSADKWTLRSVVGPEVALSVSGPPVDWRGSWLQPGQTPPTKSVKTLAGPVDWFLDASEALGNAALATVTASSGNRNRVEALELCLQVVTDHEILHQRLGDAARAMYG